MSNLTTKRQAAFFTASSALFLLGGYEFIRSASNTLLKKHYGVSSLPYAMVVVPLVVMVVLWIYGRMLLGLGARRTLFWTSVGSGVLLLGCYLGIHFGLAPFSLVLYWIREAYVVLLIEQYWSFLNSTLGTSEAKKWNGPITGWATVGAIFGGMTVYKLAPVYGTEFMIVLGAISVLPAAWMSDIAYSKGGEPKPEPRKKERTALELGLFKTSPMLTSLFLLIVVTQIMSTVLGLRFQEMLQVAIPDPDLQTSYSGMFFSQLNGLAAGLQFIAAPLLMRFLPFSWIHMGIPFVHLFFISLSVAFPGLGTVGAAYMVFKGFDYSLFRAAKEMLYIPLSFDARYRAKEVIDVFAYRFGKGGTSLLITAFQSLGMVVQPFFPWVALGAAFGWLGLGKWILKQPEVRKL